MCSKNAKLIGISAVVLAVLSCSLRVSAQGPSISGVTPVSGPVGMPVTIVGSGFGATQGSSTVSVGGTTVTPNTWSDSAIAFTVTSGLTTGQVSVTVNGQPAQGPTFTVTALPSGWSDQDIGSTGVAGSAAFANGTFTVTGAGMGTISETADSFHFAYQSLSGDGSIVARVASVQGGYDSQAGVMIRETLSPGATHAFSYFFYTSSIQMSERTSTGATSSYQSVSNAAVPYWIELTRSGNTFTSYGSSDGVNWVQLGSSQTVVMAQNVYIGLGVTNHSTSSLATATFDSVSISTASAPAPAITSLSATTGAIGSQLVISGSNLGARGLATLNGSLLPIGIWSNTSITATIPSGATSGKITVYSALSLNASNPVGFTVTSQPLPSGWLDQDIGAAGLLGSATFANGTFTVSGAGANTFSETSDKFHFVYQPLSGDGTVIAKVVSLQGSSTAQAGVMIRETLSPGATHAFTFEYSGSVYMSERTSTGGNTSYQSLGGHTVPYWIKLIRSGNSFTSYGSPDGVNWNQLGSTQTVNMTQNVYVGLAVTSGSTSTLATGTFENVTVNSTSAPAPTISSVSATTGAVGSQVVISGTNFGASQGSSVVTLNYIPVTVNYWSTGSIIFTIPSGASSGPLIVTVAPDMNDSNPVTFTVTTQPLPGGWLDIDVGQVGLAGSGTFSNGTFTVQASGTGTWSTSADQIHFVYQPLDGDGEIIARLVSLQNGYAPEAGVAFRETLNPNATEALAIYYSGVLYTMQRTSTGATTTYQTDLSVSLPKWMKLVRSGGTFTAYASSDGTTWTQLGSTHSITMAQSAYVGLAVSSLSNSSLTTATFDNVSVVAGAIPNIISLSPYSGGVGTTVTISGTDFGASQGNSTVTFNGAAAASIVSWSNTQIVATVPSTVPGGTGPVVVTVNSVPSNATVLFTAFNPIISSLTPPSAVPTGYVTVNGSGFGASQGASQALLNGTALSIGSWSDTAISVHLPSNATSGPIAVSVGGFTSNSVQVTVMASLSITVISPEAGPVATAVTITGTGFGSTQSDSSVAFDGVTASVESWNNTSITAVVPAGAATGAVSVEVADVTADGPTFTVSSSAVVTDSLGNQSTYISEIAGGMWLFSNAQGSGCSSCTVRGNVSNQYDEYGNLTSTTDPRGYTTSYAYDTNNNLTSVTQPAVSGGTPTTAYTYNSFGEVLTTTDSLGNVTTNTYDSHGNLLTVTTPPPNGNTAASVTQFAYNSLGELTQITDPLNNVTKITYTPQGYIASITDPQNNVTSYGYDSRGSRTSVTDAMSHVTSFTYDSGNRLTQITYPDNSTTSYGYDYRGRRTSMTDQNGKTTTYAYDDADRLTSVTDPAGNVTQYGYDTENNLTSITDANNHTTNFQYDAYGRVTQTTFPSNYFETYQYDADNNLTSKTDRNGRTIQYVYDAINRLTEKDYPDSTSAEYIYDLVGKILQVNDPTGTYAFAYDNMGRLIGTTTTYSFLPNVPFSNSYSYDADSNRTGYTAPDSSTNTYTYDTLNRLIGLANSWAGSFGYSYDSLSRRTQMTRPNGISTNYTYDSLSRLLSVLHQTGGSTIDGAVYTLDAAGNRTAKTDDLAGVTSNYTYDKIYELTQVMQGANTTESYSYDPVGNRLSSLGVPSYTVNSSNELTSDSNASYTYDQNGNTISKTNSSGTTSYSWDFENRLTSATLPGSGGTVNFKYDPFGRRIQKAFTQNGTTTTTSYVYNGDNLVETTDQIGNVVAKFAQGQSIDEPLAESTSGGTDYYEQDGLGSVTSLTSATGSIAQTYTYDSFGNTTHSTGSVANSFQYAARDFDVETGLYFLRSRYVAPTVGRFVSEDPQRSAMNSMNLYEYVSNNPVEFIDPDGLSPINWGSIFNGTLWARRLKNATGFVFCEFYCFECQMFGRRQDLDKAYGNNPDSYTKSMLGQYERTGSGDGGFNQIRTCTQGDPNCSKCLECMARQGVSTP